jgi:hypothetical protein
LGFFVRPVAQIGAGEEIVSITRSPWSAAVLTTRSRAANA